jgi:hypothetical protein
MVRRRAGKGPRYKDFKPVDHRLLVNPGLSVWISFRSWVAAGGTQRNPQEGGFGDVEKEKAAS